MDAWTWADALPPWAGPVLVGLSVASGLGLLVAAIGLPRVLASLPDDWLLTRESAPPDLPRYALRAGIAGVLFVAGVAMLVLPGQGVLTLLAAAVVSPIRGKKAFVRWLVSFSVVERAVNALRARRGAPPLVTQRPPGTDNGVSARS